MTEIKHVIGDDVKGIRQLVFCDEQGYPLNKLFDEADNRADFLAVLTDGEIVGCGRFYEEDKNIFHIDNIALLKCARGTGDGKKLVDALCDECVKASAEKITVNAQSYATGFYEKCGFAICGCEFTDENFKRVPMEKTFWFENCERLRADENLQAYIARKVFMCGNIKKVILRASAMGFFIPYINGQKITDEMCIPAFSDYGKRDLSHAVYPIFDTMCHRSYYLEYDITTLVNNGKNVLSFHVGDGWYAQKNNNVEQLPIWGSPNIIFKIIVTDNNESVTEIPSDESVKYTKSYVKQTDIYTKEIIDGRLIDESIFSLDYDDSACKNMTKVNVPPTQTVKQNFSGDKIAYSIEPEVIYTDENYTLYDLKKDVAGLPVIKFKKGTKSGVRTDITVAEAIDENFDFILRHTGGEDRKQCDEYIYGGEEREFHPVFTWRAGRYIKVGNAAELVRFDVAFSPVPVTAELKTSNETLDWLFNTYVNTQNCNIHSMIPSDCPHRERLGYTGDGQLCSGAAMTIFDSEKMYRKWMEDIADCQDIYTGHVQHTAPFYGGGGGPGGWGCAIVTVPYKFMKKFGDISPAEKYYGRMMKYLSYMHSRCDGNIVVREEKKGWCLGDWCTPLNDIKIPPEFVNTYFYIKSLEMVREISEVLKRSDDTHFLEKRKKEVCESFKDRFFDSKTGSFADGLQGADAFAVDIGLGDERTMENLSKKYESLGEYDTGIFGTDILTRVLLRNDRQSLAWKLLTNEKEISFFNMKKHGATTLWENWDGCDSLSHPMFGAVCEYIFTDILGIKYENGEISVEPVFLPETGDIAGSVITPKGRVSVNIKYTDGVRAITYSLPE